MILRGNSNFLRTLLLLLIISIFCMGAITILASEPKYGGVLRVATRSAPLGLDSAVTGSIATREVACHVYENLLSFDSSFAVQPMLAESWDISEDGTVYTFYLREGVPFHNGKILKAEDVKASLEWFRERGVNKHFIEDVNEINILDDYTIELKLNQPSGTLLPFLGNTTTYYAITPLEVVEKAKETGEFEVVGTGPYYLDEWITDRYVRLKRFEDYQPLEGIETSAWSGPKKAYLDEILLIPVPEGGSRVAGIEAGDYDFADAIPTTEVPRLKENDKIVVVEQMPNCWPVIYINQSEHSIFNDLKLRQAVQAGLDHNEIMLASSEGSGRLDPGMFFIEQATWHSDIAGELYNQNDPEKAKRLMEEAGYNGEEITVLTNTNYDYMYKASIVVERQLSNLGFNVNLVVTDWPTQNDIKKDLSKWHLSFSSHSPRWDPVVNDSYFREYSFMGVDNPELIEALDKGKFSTNYEDRYEAYEDVQRILYEQVHWIKLYDLGVYQARRENVKGYESLPYAVYFVNTWLDK